MLSFTLRKLTVLLGFTLCSCSDIVAHDSCADASCVTKGENDAAAMLQLSNTRIVQTSSEGDEESMASSDECDPNCKDTINQCEQADNNWNMCDVVKRNGDKWWADGCKKTCGTCKACSGPGSQTDCDPRCKDKKPTSVCKNADKVWNMCKTDRWWRNQCKVTCNHCRKGLPPCGGSSPTSAPTQAPTEAPTTEEPTEAPTTEEPTAKPTDAPTEEPTEAPTEEPTDEPTEAPTEAPSGDWETGTATYYGDAGSGGHCGGTELWPEGYASGTGWIDGLYVATASHMWCEKGTSCGNKHSNDCGHCYEVKCTGTHTNTDGYEPCTGKTVTVAVTDECPGGSANPTHCTGDVNHFDLSTKAFKVIGAEQAGVLDIKWRQVDCPVPAGVNLKLVVLGDQWWFKMAAKDVAGSGHIEKIEIKSQTISSWRELDGDYGAFFKSTTNVGGGPYHFKLTAGGKELEYTMQGLESGTYDIGANFA